MGWLSGPREQVGQDSLALRDGRQGRMALDPFGVDNPNNAGMLSPDGSYPNYAISGYGRNELAYACITARAQSLPQSVMRVYPGGQGEALDEHRLRQIIEQPCPEAAEFEFFELSVTYLDLAGTLFWLVVKGRDGLPSQVWPIRPDLIGVLPSPRNPAEFTWVLRPDPNKPQIMVPIPDAGSPAAAREPASMIRIRYPNPDPTDMAQRYFGMPPLRPGARAITLYNAATDFTDTLLRNHALPAAVVTTAQRIDETLHERLRASWRRAFGGGRKGEPAFLQQGMDVKVLGLNLRDLEFPDLRAYSETRICAAIGVPPILVGAKFGLEHNAYKDYHEARLSFWEEYLFSLQRRFIDPVRTRLLPAFTGVGRRSVRVAWDNSGVPALKESESEKWQRATDALARGGITRNDFRRIVGLPAVPGGDVFLTPAGVLAEPSGQGAGLNSTSTKYGLLAAEHGIELAEDELAALCARSHQEGIDCER